MMQIDFVKRWLSRILAALTVSAVYLYGYPSATISYFVVELFHVAIGVVLTILLLFCVVPSWHPFSGNLMALFKRVAGRRRHPARLGICRADALHGGYRCRNVVDARSRLEERESHLKSADAPGHDGQRR